MGETEIVLAGDHGLALAVAEAIRWMSPSAGVTVASDPAIRGRITFTYSGEDSAMGEAIAVLDRSPEGIAALIVAGPGRSEWPHRIRKATERRWDEVLSSVYDDGFGGISFTHRVYLDRLLDLLPPKSVILDAPCGTGKYWDMVMARGHHLIGADQSREILRLAQAKHPSVETRHMSLQEIEADVEVDAAVCIDAMEYIPPEEWPGVLRRLCAAVRPGGLVYLTVEEPDEDLEAALMRGRGGGLPLVWGESVNDEGGYHYFPPKEAVRSWVKRAGLEYLAESDGDGYHHVLARRKAA